MLDQINRWIGIRPDASAQGGKIDHLLALSHWYLFAIFAGWFVFFVIILFRFHHSRNPKANYHGARSKLFSGIEIGMVVLIIVEEMSLLFGYAMPIWKERTKQKPANAAVVLVVAQQFAWNFHYPGTDGKFGKTAPQFISPENPVGVDRNDPAGRDDIISHQLHLPVNKEVILKISSFDVIHSFVVASMRIAQDAIPGLQTPIWFKPVKTGTYEIVCGQLCGLGHYSMRTQLIVESPQKYAAWLKKMHPLAISEK